MYGMALDIIHSKEEFHKFPWNNIEKNFKESWVEGEIEYAWGKGGIIDQGWQIYGIKSLPDGDVQREVWILPDYLNYILETMRESGIIDAKRQIACKWVAFQDSMEM